MYVLLEIERMGHRLHDGHTNHVWMSYAYSVVSMQHSTVVRNQCNLHYLHTTTCDRICEKRSYTPIQFFNFKDM